jgi:hypothetical protein
VKDEQLLETENKNEMLLPLPLAAYFLVSPYENESSELICVTDTLQVKPR